MVTSITTKKSGLWIFSQDCAVRPNLESLSSLTTLTHLEVSLHHTFVDSHTFVPGEPAFHLQQQQAQMQLEGGGGVIAADDAVAGVEQSAAEVVFCGVTSW